MRGGHARLASSGPGFGGSAARQQPLGEVLALLELAELAPKLAAFLLDGPQALSVGGCRVVRGAALDPAREGEAEAAEYESTRDDDHDLGDFVDVHGRTMHATTRAAQPPMTTAIHRQVAEAAAGRLPRVITRLPSGWAVLGDPQILPGYALLLPDPVVPHLNALDSAERARFLSDMGRLGDAVLAVTGAERINYEILGNVEPALHAHVIPRFAWETPDRRRTPVWLHDWDTARPYDAEGDRALLTALARTLADG